MSREREREQLNEKKFPTLSCVLAMEVFCVALTLGISFRSAPAFSPFRFAVRRSSSAVQPSKFTRQAERFPELAVLRRVREIAGVAVYSK